MNFDERYYASEEAFREKLAELKENSTNFVDENFPAEEKSIIDPNDIIDDLMDLGPVEWKRAKEIPALLDASGNLHIFSGKIEPNDIQQGQIGDCYFLSSIAALSENEGRIRKMFLTEEVDDAGMYGVTMFKNGKKMIVAVDDLFPCKGDSVAFARSNGAELWVLLLEKMWAKLHGCYDRIAGGLEYETIRDLTGAPGYFFSGIDDDTFERIYEFDQANYVMGCSMSDQYDVAAAEAQGIVPGHAYTLLTAKTVTDKNGKDHRLVKLRNPWGSGEWNGRWSDKSAEWTPELRRAVGFDGDRDDGIFWMDFDDFQEIYGFWSVNKYLDGAKFTSEEVTNYIWSSDDYKARYKNPTFQLFRVTTKEAGFHTFAVSQFGNRLLKRKADYKYANVIAYLVKETTENSFKDCTLVEASITRQDRDTYLEVEDLPVGNYWLYIDVEWQPTTYQCMSDIKKNCTFQYSVNCYGVGEVEFETQSDQEQVEVLSHMLQAYCQFHHDQQDDVVKVDESQYAGIQIWEESNYWETGYNFKLVNNTTADQVMVLCHSHLDFKNGFILKPKEEDSSLESYKVSRSQYAFSVPPNTKRGIFAKPYTGFSRGGQAHTPYVVDLGQFDKDIMSYYMSHYNRYQLSNHNVPVLNEEKDDDSKLPNDLDEVEDEGTAPAVKSGFKPGSTQRQIKDYQMLVVVPHDDDVHKVDDISKHEDFLAKTSDASKGQQEMNLKVKITTFEAFKNKKKEDTYDFVAFAFFSSFNRHTIQEQVEYITYYISAPVVGWFVSKKFEKEETNMRGATNYLLTNFKNKFKKENKTFLPSKTSEAVGSFYLTVKQLAQTYDKIKHGEVKKAFDMFDKDSNGTIDQKEFGELSRLLGQSLTTPQIKDAFKDLDLDHNGVIDFDEFSRWYFTGMKSYNQSTRSILQVANTTTTVFEALKNKEISDILHNNQKLTKHRIAVNLNSPPDGQRIEVKFNAFGPETTKLKNDAYEYKQGLLDKIPVEKNQLFGIYVRIKANIKRSSQRKLKSAVKELQEFFNKTENKEKVYPVINVIKDQVVFQMLVPIKENDWIPKSMIPESLIEPLMDIDQGAKFKFTLGFSPQEVVDCKKSIAQLVCEKGLKAELDIHFLKSIHKALNAAFKDNEAGEVQAFKYGLSMAGPAFGLNTRLNLDVKFKEFEELESHPMANYMVFTLSQLFEMTTQRDLKAIKEGKFDLSEFDPEKLQELVDKEEITENNIDNAKSLHALMTIFEELDPVTKADLDVYLNDMFSVNGQVRGHGFGELIAAIIRGCTFDMRKSDHQRVHKAYLKAYDPQKFEEVYGEEERARMMEEQMCDGDAMMDAPCEEMMAMDWGMDDMECKMMDEYAPMMMEEYAPMMMEDRPDFAVIKDDEAAPLIAGKSNQPKKVKSKYTAPSSAVPQDDFVGDSEQMKKIKEYIQEQVQLRVNAAIDQEAERQIDLQMREFKEEALREAMNRVPPVSAGNKEGAQIGRMPATIAMASQKKDGPINSPRGGADNKGERSTRASRKDRAIGGIPSNTLRRAEIKKANSPTSKLRR